MNSIARSGGCRRGNELLGDLPNVMGQRFIKLRAQGGAPFSRVLGEQGVDSLQGHAGIDDDFPFHSGQAQGGVGGGAAKVDIQTVGTFGQEMGEQLGQVALLSGRRFGENHARQRRHIAPDFVDIAV